MNSQDSGLSNETFCGGTPGDEEPTLREILAPFAAAFESVSEEACVANSVGHCGYDEPDMDLAASYGIKVRHLQAAWEYLEKLKKTKP